MFPEESEVFGPESPPTFVMADKSCIEAVDLWRRNDLGSSVSAEGSDHMNNERGLKDCQRTDLFLQESSISFNQN